MSIVVDASVALSWCFEDEASEATDAMLDRVGREGAIVPGLWHLEIANILHLAERRGRTITGGVAGRLELLTQLPILVDPETALRAFRKIFGLARAQGLTTYDACYLELAARRGLPLATRDAALAHAARRVGVPVLPETVEG